MEDKSSVTSKAQSFHSTVASSVGTKTQDEKAASDAGGDAASTFSRRTWTSSEVSYRVAPMTVLDTSTATRPVFEQRYLARAKLSYDDSQFVFSRVPWSLVRATQRADQAQHDLEAARQRYGEWRGTLQQKRKEIDSSHRHLEQSQESTELFSQHHIMEIQRALQRAKEEAATSKSLADRIDALVGTESELRLKLHQLEERIREMQPVVDYVQRVADMCRIYASPEALLAAHSEFDSKRALVEEHYQETGRIENQEGVDASRDRERRQIQLVEKARQLSALIAKAGKTRIKNSYVKSELMKDVQRLDGKREDVVAIKTALVTLYRMVMRRTHSKAPRVDTDIEQLAFIARQFQDYTTIVSAAGPGDFVTESPTARNIHGFRGTSVHDSQHISGRSRAVSSSGSRAGVQAIGSREPSVTSLPSVPE